MNKERSPRHGANMGSKPDAPQPIHEDESIAENSAESLTGLRQREGLSDRDRSTLSLAMLTVLGRTQELPAHIKIATDSGMTMTEIREVLLQAAVYTGLPVDHATLLAAQGVLDDIEEQ